MNESVSGSITVLQEEIIRLRNETENSKNKRHLCEICKRRISLSTVGMRGSIANKIGFRRSIIHNSSLISNDIEKIQKQLRRSTISNIPVQNSLPSFDENKKINEESFESDFSEDSETIKEKKGKLNDEIKKFIEKIDDLIKNENVINDKLTNSSKIINGIRELENFKQKYEMESKEMIEELEKKKNYFMTLIKLNEKMIIEMKDSTGNRNLMESLEIYLKESEKLKENHDYVIEINKLREENKRLKNEIETVKRMKSFEFIFNRPNFDFLSSIINDYVETNKEIQEYLSQNIECFIKEDKIHAIKLENDSLKQSIKIKDNTILNMTSENYLLSKNDDFHNNFLNEEDFNLIKISLDQKFQENEQLKKENEFLSRNLDSNQILINQLKEECDTLYQGTTMYENMIKEKNSEITKYKNDVIYFLFRF